MREGYDALQESVYDYRPFYVPQVYDLAKALLAQLSELHRIVTTPEAFFKPRDRDRAEVVMAKINDKCIPQLCETIRKRVFPGQLDDTFENSLTEADL